MKNVAATPHSHRKKTNTKGNEDGDQENYSSMLLDKHFCEDYQKMFFAKYAIAKIPAKLAIKENITKTDGLVLEKPISMMPSSSGRGEARMSAAMKGVNQRNRRE